MKIKKTLIIIIIILILVLGYVVYVILTQSNIAPFRKNAIDIEIEKSKEQDNDTLEKDLPKVEYKKKINKLTNQAIIAPIISPDKEHIRYFKKSNGHLMERALDGTREIAVLDSNIQGLKSAIWAPDKKQLIYILNSEEKYYYNLETQQTILLDPNIKNIVWSPDSLQIAYKFTDLKTKINGIATSKPNGENSKLIYSTILKNLNLSWPEQNKITFLQNASAFAPSALYSINPSNSNFDIILNNYYGLITHYTENNLIYSYSEKRGTELKSFALNANTKKSQSLGLSTIANKCTIDTNFLIAYCAVPENLNGKNILPDDYYKNLINFHDAIQSIDLATGKKQKIASQSELENIDAWNLILSPNNDKLYLTDKNTGILYLINLD